MANITGHGNNTLNESTKITFHQQIPAGITVFLLALNTFLAITAFLGNALILIALHKVTTIYPPTKLLFRCLAVTDLCVGLIVQPLHILTVYTDYISDYLEIRFYVFRFSVVLFCTLSLLTSTAISVDRLLALSLGQRYRHVVTLRRVRAVIVCFWLISALCGPMPLFNIFIDPLFLVLIIIFLVISLSSYMKILFTLRRQQAQLQHHVQPGQPNGGGNPLNIVRYKKTVSTIAWVQLALFVCYSPWVVVEMHGKFSGSRSWNTVTSRLGATFVFLNSALNPLLYCWRIKDVRQEVKNMIRKICCSSS